MSLLARRRGNAAPDPNDVARLERWLILVASGQDDIEAAWAVLHSVELGYQSLWDRERPHDRHIRKLWTNLILRTRPEMLDGLRRGFRRAIASRAADAIDVVDEILAGEIGDEHPDAKSRSVQMMAVRLVTEIIGATGPLAKEPDEEDEETGGTFKDALLRLRRKRRKTIEATAEAVE